MRLGLDIGTTSIGWWLYETEGVGSSARITRVIDGGVRIFLMAAIRSPRLLLQ